MDRSESRRTRWNVGRQPIRSRRLRLNGSHPLRESALQVCDREGEVSEAAGPGVRETEALVPRDELRVLCDYTCADDRGPSRSGLVESVQKECSAETSTSSIGGDTEPFQVRQG